MKDFLNLEQRNKLKRVNKKERSRRDADQIKATLLLDLDWTYEQIAEALLLDNQPIRNYETTYLSKGIDNLLSNNYMGCELSLLCVKKNN